MKSIPFAVALGAVASLALSPASFAAVSCPDRTPAAITAPTSEAGRSCQNAIAKAALGFVKTQVKATAGCMSKQIPGACPSTKDNEKAQKSALKARDAVAKACTGVLGDLATSYQDAPDTDTVASCTLSQNNAESRLIAFQVNGTPGVLRDLKDRNKCVKTLNSGGVKYALGALQAINKCLASNIQAGTGAVDLSETCVGHWAAGAFVEPTDEKTKESLAKLLDKLDSSIEKACSPVTASLLKGIFACPNATTVAALKNCIACGTWESSLSILAGQYSETGTVVSPGSNAIQTAVDAAGLNAKLLIATGTYQEDVSITDNSLHAGTQLVGCGGASGERPKLQPPTIGGPFLNGVFAAGVDGLVFQSLEVSGGWEENGIFVTGADGATFRDLVTDGGDGSKECHIGGNDGASCSVDADCPDGVCVDTVSTYGIFPVESSNVLVELSSAHQIRDAGIYVGSCQGVVMRYNTAIGNVAGMELENSSDGVVHNNYASGNVGGMLIFKLPGPHVQRGHDHDVFFNVSDSNDVTPNWAIPNTSVSGIPPGTGMVVLSTRNADYHHNIITNNDTYGIAAVDQEAFDALASGALGGEFSHTCGAGDPPFEKCDPDNAAVDCPVSSSCVEDQKFEDNAFFGSSITNNGGANAAPGSVGAGNIAYAVIEDDDNNNCFNNLTDSTPAVNAPLGNSFSAICP